MNAILEQINSAGLRFVEFAPSMLVQSGALILILLLTDFALRKKVRAVFRYWIWMLVLVKLILPTSLSAPMSVGYFFGDELAYANINRPAAEAEPTEPAPAIVSPTIDLTNIQADRFTPTQAPTIPTTGPVVTVSAQPPVESVTPLSWQGVVFLLWLAVVMAMGLLLLQRAIFVRGLVAQAKEADGFMADTLESCRERIRVKRKIGLKVSAKATSPAVCGLFQPVILVPQNLTSSLNKSQLRAVLLHELAHIRRGDLWVNLAQTLLQIIYFYNPLLWAANAIIRRIREQAVDEMVLVAMGEKARQYPQALVDVAKLAFKRPALSLRLIGVVESKSALAGRIKHILNRPVPKSAKLGILGLLAIIITAAILLPMTNAGPSEFRETLPNGVKVELVGLGTKPWEAEQRWWSADGTEMSRPDFKVNHFFEWPDNPKGSQFLCAALCKFSNYADKSVSMPDVRFSNRDMLVTGWVSAIADDGTNLIYITYNPHMVTVPDKADISLAVGAGPFKKARTPSKKFNEKMHETYFLEDNSVVIRHPLRIDHYLGTLTVDLTCPKKDFEFRIIAELKNGQTERWHGGSVGKEVRFFHATPRRENIKVENIEQLIIEYRPYEWVTFRNVSLQPGQKTDVEVEVQQGIINGQEQNVKLKKLSVSKSEEKEIAALAEKLRSKDETIWKEAAEKLKAIGPKVAEPLSKMFRYAPADARALDILKPMATDEHVQAVMLDNLKLDRNRYPSTRYCSLIILAESGNREHVGKIIPLFQKDIESGRNYSMAEIALGQLGGDEAYNALIEGLTKKIPDQLRYMIADHLAAMERVEAIPHLKDALNLVDPSHPSAGARIVEAIHRLEDKNEIVKKPYHNGLYSFTLSEFDSGYSQRGILYAYDLQRAGNASAYVDKPPTGANAEETMFGNLRALAAGSKGDLIFERVGEQTRLQAYHGTLLAPLEVKTEPPHHYWTDAVGKMHQSELKQLVLDYNNKHAKGIAGPIPGFRLYPFDEGDTFAAVLPSGQIAILATKATKKIESYTSGVSLSVLYLDPLLALVGTGRIKASQDSAADADKSQFIATMPNGVTVELVGICKHPSEGKQWWRPDGAILESDHAPSDYSRMTVEPDETEQARELALRFAGQDVEQMSFKWKMDMATRSSSHPFYVTEKREKLKPLRNIVFKLPQNLETLDFSIGIATGEWKEVASGGDGRTVSVTNDSLTDSSVIFHEAVKEKDTVRLCATHLLGGDYDCRIVVVDRDDEIHEPIRSSNSGSDMRLCKGFFDLSPDQIKYILLQARPYEWVEFENVSLRPAHKTDVQVGVPIVEDLNSTPPRSELLSTPILGYDVRLNFADPTIRDGSFHSKQSVAFVMSFHSIEDLKPGVLLSGLLIGQRTFSLILKDKSITIQDGSTGREIDSESWSAEEVQFNNVITLPVKYGQKEYSCPIHVEMDRHGEGVLTGSYWFCAYLSGRLPWGAGGRSFEIVNLDQQMEFRLQGDGTDKRDAVLGIDIDGDGNINPAERGGEQFNLYEPFQIDSKTYRVTEVDPYLPRVVFHEVSPAQLLYTGVKTNVQFEDTKIAPGSSGEAADSSELSGRVVDENGNTVADVQVEAETIAGDWQYIGQAIPPDFNDTMILTEHINLGSIGQDVEGKTFITFIRDGEKTQNWQYRFVLFKKDGNILEPDGHIVLGESKRLEEKFTFDEPFISRRLKGFRFQSRPLPPPGTDDISSQLQKAASEEIKDEKISLSGLAPPGRYAIELDGVDDYLLVPDSPSLKLEPPFTVEMWVKTKLPPDASEYRGGWAVISKGFYVGTPRAYVTGFGINLDRHPEEPSKLHIDFCKANNSGTYSSRYGGYPLTNGVSEWIHITHVFDGEYYKSTPGYPLVMGKFLIPTENPLMGQLGEVRLWNGARTRQELRQYKNVALTGTEPGLAACWTFEQTEGQFAYDISGNNNHARLGRAPEADDADPKWIDIKTTSDLPDQKTNLQVEDTKIETDNSSEVDSGELVGRVVDENGNTVADAQVALSTEKIGVLVSNGKLQPIRSDVESRIVQTDSQGMFEFGQMPVENFDLIVAHEKGFAMVESEEFVASGEIHLQPWSCIEGQLAEGRKAAGNKIWMSSLPNPTWFRHKREYRDETKCDESGHFVFDKVPSGWFEVGYLTRSGKNSWSITSRTPVVVKTGQSTKMRLGGEGRPVTGRFVPPEGYDKSIYFGEGSRSLLTVRPQEPRPDNYDRMTKQQQRKWREQWHKTDEYKKYRDDYWHNPDWRQYTFFIEEDGSFRIDDVIVGKYQLTVWIEERHTGQGRPEEIAGYYGTIEVPEMPGGRSDEPLDLGELKLTMHNPLRLGDIAPLFEAKTLDGKDLKLIDYRGKFVLLSFWQPVFHPEKQQLQELYDTYGGNRQLEIIGLGGNDTLEEIKNYVRENAIPWPQIFTGEEFKSGIAKDYGGFGIFLIDPDGRIIAKDLRGEKLKSTVNETLKITNVNKTDVQVEVEQGNESSEPKNTEDYDKIPSDSVVVRVVDTKGRIIPIKDVPYTRIYYRDATTGNPIGWQIDLQIEKTLSDGSFLVNHRDVLVRKFLGMNRETKRNDYTISMCFQPKEGPVFSATTLYPQKATDILSFVVPPRTKVAGVGNIAPDELAGRVVDVDGNPVAGATISVYPDRGLENHPFKTDSKGAYRIPGFSDRWCLYIKVEKDGYATQWLTDFEIGKNFIVTMDQSTVLQGVFVNDSGEQAGRTQITLAKNKLTMQPRRGNSVGPITMTHETDDKGSYDFPVEPGLYDVKVASESGLFNRSRVFIGAGQIVSLPSTLKPSIRFQVKVVDSLTNKPIKGVDLWIDSRTAGRVAMKEGSRRTTDSKGLAVWESLMPGNTSFSIMKKGYCRWWSDACLRGFGTFKSVSYPGGYNWQRNIDSLRFDLIADMPVVVIKMEEGVKLSGRVLSPEGKPIAKAWVDITPADGPHTLTGDSRYRMITDENGRFGIEEKYWRGYVPAGKQVLYNVCAHDPEARWANAVSKPFASKPGDEFEFTLKMTKGGWVSGRVIDSEGKPVPDIEVEAIAEDNLDTPYFNPRALTDENGTFTLGPMREGKYWTQPDTMKGVNIARSPKQEKTEVKVVDGKVTSVGNLLFRTGGPNM